MALVKAKTVSDLKPVTYDSPIAAKIQQRRYQILVHSLLYYDADISLVSDAMWSKWAQELVELQEAHPAIAEKVIFANAFKDFDGSSGFNLPYRDEQIVNIAYRLLKTHDSAESENALHILRYVVDRIPAEYEQYKKKSHTIEAVAPVKREVKHSEQKQRKGLFSVSGK